MEEWTDHNYGMSPVAEMLERRIWFPLPDFQYADGSMTCEVCGKPFRKHPFYPLFDWLNILCDGRLVKL